MMSRTISRVALTKPLGEPDHNRFTAFFLSLFDHARNLSRGGNTNGAINTDDKNSGVACALVVAADIARPRIRT